MSQQCDLLNGNGHLLNLVTHDRIPMRCMSSDNYDNSHLSPERMLTLRGLSLL